jgi:hypothetical protein
MSSDREDNSQEGPAVPGQPFTESRSGTVRAVLHVRPGAGTPFEGTVEVGYAGRRAFHGWLELMGLMEEARANAAP